MYQIYFSPQAMKDKKRIEQAGLKEKVKKLLSILAVDPCQTPPAYEKLIGNLSGFYSRRINLQHRLVYQVLPNEENRMDADGTLYEGVVKIIRMWTHYEHIR